MSRDRALPPMFSHSQKRSSGGRCSLRLQVSCERKPRVAIMCPRFFCRLFYPQLCGFSWAAAWNTLFDLAECSSCDDLRFGGHFDMVEREIDL